MINEKNGVKYFDHDEKTYEPLKADEVAKIPPDM